MNFEGETAPYIQYTHTRCCSLLRKYQGDFDNCDYTLLGGESEREIISLLENFNSVVIEASKKYEPCFVARFLIDLSSSFNKFYFEERIISEDENLSKARMVLTKAVRDTIAKGLYLIGIKAPIFM